MILNSKIYHQIFNKDDILELAKKIGYKITLKELNESPKYKILKEISKLKQEKGCGEYEEIYNQLMPLITEILNSSIDYFIIEQDEDYYNYGEERYICGLVIKRIEIETNDCITEMINKNWEGN